MTLLLDTHAVLWFWWADPQLSATASSLICDPANRKLVSPASAWEIAIKVSLAGRISPGDAIRSGRHSRPYLAYGDKNLIRMM